MYHPTGRVLTVLEILQFRPGITGPELADRLEVDVRTVRRYVAKLQDVGIPVEATPGRYGGYRLRPGYKLPPLVFTQDEAATMVLALFSSRVVDLGVAPATVAAAVSKITRVLPERAQSRLKALSDLIVIQSDGDGQSVSSETLIELSQAIQERKTLDLTYTSDRGVTTRRIVEPYGLVTRRGRWYLVAYCRLRSDYRIFRVDRAAEVRVRGEGFRATDEFDCRAFAEDSLNSSSGGVAYVVQFECSADELRRRVGRAFGTIRERADGAAGVSFAAMTDDFAYEARFLAGLGLPFTVVQPPELSDAVRRLARRLEASVR